jgi:ligand-binding sensor domain-containing protein
VGGAGQAGRHRPRAIIASATPPLLLRSPQTWRRFGALAAFAAIGLAWPAGARAASTHDKEPNWHNVDVWKQADGLPQATVFTVLQTRDGYMWIGTKGGVSRFDGVRFTTYDDRDKTQLGENEVWALVEGDDASLWIATFGGGLSRLKDGRFTVYTTRDGLASDFVAALCKDRAGHIWIGTEAGLSRFDGTVFTNYAAKDGLDRASIRALSPDPAGGLWIGTTRGGVYRMQDGRIRNVPVDGLGAASDVRSILADRHGSVWIATPDGVFRLLDGRTIRHTVADGLGSERADGVYEDKAGRLWITTDKGLSRYRDGHFVSYPLGNLTAMGEDHEGSLWIGFGEDGVARLRAGQFVTFTNSDGLPYDFVSTILQDRAGNIWVGTAAGLGVLRDGKFVAHPGGESLPKAWVLSLGEDRQGRIWLGMGPRLYRSREGAPCTPRRCEPRFEEVAGLPGTGASVRVIHEDRAGTVWIGTSLDGLLRYEEGRFTRLTTADGLASNAVRAMAEDAEGGLWIGTRGGGLSRLKDGRFVNYSTTDGLASNSIQALHLDTDGVLWIATRQGLNRLKDGRFTTYTVNDGLYDNFAYNFAEDDLGYLWMGCSKGVFRVARKELNDFAEGRTRSIASAVYGVEHGLGSPMSVVPYFPSARKTADGRIWMATPRGVSVVDPRSLTTNTIAPRVHIEEVTIDQETLPLGETAQVRPGRGDLVLRYTALSFLAPEKVRFRYRLEGYDREWIDAGTRRMVQYTNIPPGGYRFVVVASNNDGVWNEKGASFAFRLQPRFYQTIWFYALCAIATALAGAATQRLRVARLKARELELSARVEQAVGQIKVLRGLLPICASCKKIRDDSGYWNQMETYVSAHSDVDFSHSICPDCMEKLYPDYAKASKEKTSG